MCEITVTVPEHIRIVAVEMVEIRHGTDQTPVMIELPTGLRVKQIVLEPTHSREKK